MGNHEWCVALLLVTYHPTLSDQTPSWRYRFDSASATGPGNASQGDFRAYLARTHMPSPSAGLGADGLYYSFDIGLVHFVMLQGYCPEMTNTSVQSCLRAGGSQAAWLQSDLGAVDRALTPWVVVTFHQPYANSNTAHPMSLEGFPMQAAIEDVLYEARVDLVLSGHVHSYERSCRLYRLQCVADGIVYITIGDGGNREGLAAEWTMPQPAWSRFRLAAFGHGELTAVNATALEWSWTSNPTLDPAGADSFVLVKGVAAGMADTEAARRLPGVTRQARFRAGYER